MFDSTKTSLNELLRQAEKGKIQLPDFQRGWVWDDYGIRSLLASISQSFPVGAVMMLQAGGEVKFGARPLEGLPENLKRIEPDVYLLDGQQRLTSLYQACVGQAVIKTMNAQRRQINRWYYIDMRKALDGSDREDAIIGVPEDRIIRSDFGRVVDLDLSTQVHEFDQMMFPVNQVFTSDQWQMGFAKHWKYDQGKMEFWFEFQNRILGAFKEYHVPVITLDKTSTREAVCLVFEKVNTGGKKLDAFELLTAIFASSSFNLREDWLGPDDDRTKPGRRDRLAQHDVLAETASTDFLQAVALLHGIKQREKEEAAGKTGKDLPPVSCNRKAILSLPLDAYQRWADTVEAAFIKAAKFLALQKIFWHKDVPYKTQLVPLAAIIALLGDDWQKGGVRARLAQWFWCGVFGEQYGSAVESRFAKDVQEVPAWVRGGGERPSTVVEASFSPERLRYLRSRLSAAYKGVNALLMLEGARDFQSGQPYEYTNFWNESVDIHHIFPKVWCKAQGIEPRRFDCVVNKTPISAGANRAIGGVAPSKYLDRLEQKTGLDADRLDRILDSHLIPAPALRADDFDSFFDHRAERILGLIEKATGMQIQRDGADEEAVGDEVIDRDDVVVEIDKPEVDMVPFAEAAG